MVDLIIVSAIFLIVGVWAVIVAVAVVPGIER
jgi:hypothetical protein